MIYFLIFETSNQPRGRMALELACFVWNLDSAPRNLCVLRIYSNFSVPQFSQGSAIVRIKYVSLKSRHTAGT